MTFRKLRVAWSLGCGIACVLLIVLWVRSNVWTDGLCGPLSGSQYFVVTSVVGRLFCDTATHQSSDEPTFALISVRMQDMGLSTKQEILDEFGSDIWMPTWLLIVAIATIGVVPWIRWSKRFGLRTLLITTTLIAVVLGLIVAVLR